MLFFRSSPSALAFAGFACLATLTSLTPNVAAQTAQVCFTDNIAMTPTNWSDQVTFSKFDPALGTLQTIDITFTGSIVGSAQTESLDTGPTTVTLTFEGSIVLTRPDMSQLAAVLPQAQFVDTFTGFDGSVDFGGTSGATHPNVSATQTVSAASPPPPSDLIAFTGPIGNPGTISLPVMAVGTSVSTGSGNIVSQFTQSASADVTVCYTYLPNTPPTFQPPTPVCNSVLTATAGVPFTFTVCVGDSDPGDTVTLNGTLPPGATAVPNFPVVGNPACATINWTPALAQVGSHTFTFTAVDTHQRTAACQITVLVAECYQFVGRGDTGSTITVGGYPFDTFLGSVRYVWPVTMANHPSIPIPSLASGQLSFSMQTVMYNPEEFPTNPDQWSQRLRVTILPGHVVVGELLQSENGVHQSLATFTNPLGEHFLTFPFTIEGEKGHK